MINDRESAMNAKDAAYRVAWDEINRLRAENASLRAAGQAVVRWLEPPFDHMSEVRLDEAHAALRAALKEGGA